MIILLLAGCSAEVVAEEYHLSEQGLGPAWKAEAVGRLLRHPVFKGSDSNGISRMVGAREEVMRAVVMMVERQWGGVEGFLRGVIGVDEDTIGTYISGVDPVCLMENRGRTPDFGSREHLHSSRSILLLRRNAMFRQ